MTAQLKHLNPKQIATTLYAPNSRGALGFKDILSLKTCNSVIEAAELSRSQGNFTTPQRVRGKVIQEMQMSYLERMGLIPAQLAETIGPIAQSLEEFFIPFSANSSLCQDLRDTYLFDTHFNSVGVHYYPENTGGITPHRDFSVSLNLIVIFILSGDAALYVCDDRNGNNGLRLDHGPGSMVILRAPRNGQEQCLRPFHYLTSSSTPRYSLIFRQECGPVGDAYA